MIIACEQCDTRFQLDETRIPAKGARVRCSRCKHAFFVRRPEVAEEEALDEVVAEATDPGASGAPPPTRDLEPPSDEGAGPEREGLDAFEADWEFNDEPAAAAASAPAASPRPEAPAPPRASEAATPRTDAAADAADAGALDEDLDALGDPEEWNLLADLSPATSGRDAEPADADDPLEDLLGGLGSGAEAGAAQDPAGLAEEPERTPAAPAPEAEGRRTRRLPALGGALAGLGWTATLGLVALALQALAGQALDPPRATTPGARTLELPDGGVARDVRSVYLENALAGPLLVVSGSLEDTVSGTDRGLVLQLEGPDGAALPGATSWVGPPLSSLQLREMAPEVLREALARGAASLALTGGGRFHAVFAEVPQDAADFSFRARPLPRSSPPPPPAPSSE